jgi:hypothetical protein
MRFGAVFFCQSERDRFFSVTVCAHGCPFMLVVRVCTELEPCRLYLKERESLRACVFLDS